MRNRYGTDQGMNFMFILLVGLVFYLLSANISSFSTSLLSDVKTYVHNTSTSLVAGINSVAEQNRISLQKKDIQKKNEDLKLQGKKELKQKENYVSSEKFPWLNGKLFQINMFLYDKLFYKIIGRFDSDLDKEYFVRNRMYYFVFFYPFVLAVGGIILYLTYFHLVNIFSFIFSFLDNFLGLFIYGLVGLLLFYSCVFLADYYLNRERIDVLAEARGEEEEQEEEEEVNNKKKEEIFDLQLQAKKKYDAVPIYILAEFSKDISGINFRGWNGEIDYVRLYSAYEAWESKTKYKK